MSDYEIKAEYTDGTVKTLHTQDGKRFMDEASGFGYPDSVDKTLTMTKDGEVIYTEKIKAYKLK